MSDNTTYTNAIYFTKEIRLVEEPLLSNATDLTLIIRHAWFIHILLPLITFVIYIIGPISNMPSLLHFERFNSLIDFVPEGGVEGQCISRKNGMQHTSRRKGDSTRNSCSK